MKRSVVTLSCGLVMCGLALACGPRTSAAAGRAAPVPEARTSESPHGSAVPSGMEQRDWGDVFEEAGFSGAFAASTASGPMICVGDCERRHSPASTFKVPHALLALELGVLSGPEHSRTWDGTERWLEAWNRDHTLHTAIQKSVLWYFQATARDIGSERMAAGLARYDYGNADCSGEVDQCWINQTLQVSPVEQVGWWLRLHDGAFGATGPAEDVLRMTELARDGSRVLRGKTGWYREADEIDRGWFVGCVETEQRTCFATVIEAEEPFDHDRFLRARKEISRVFLERLGVNAPHER